MQVCDVTLLHGGRQEMTIRKRRVSVAEIQVLRRLHGQDAVKEITPIGTSKQPHGQELRRLNALYPAKKDEKGVVEELFPGHAPKLPVTLEDIGVGKDSPFLGVPAKPVPDEEPATAQELELDDESEGAEPTQAPEPGNPLVAAAQAK